MKVSSSWLKEWLRRTMLSDEQIVSALERGGIEVEQVILLSPIDKMIVVGLVKKVVQHPGADRLKLAEVEVGERTLRIVCGAPNIREGMKAPLAQIGATLPSGDVISEAKLRGEISQGMLCSARELGLGNDHDGLLELSPDLESGTPLDELYPADTIIDVKTPANRFDVQSTVGLAREVAAMAGGEIAPLSPLRTGFSENSKVIGAAMAGMYMIAELKVTPGLHSPRKTASRLQSLGVRSLGPVVDATNWVVLECGQPLHAFDADKVKLPFGVRLAVPGEHLTTLDGVDRTLSPEDLVIADATGPIALAGVMGGASTEVDATTKRVYLEAATFDPVRVRRTAQRHGLRTEGSSRFERGIPAALPPFGLERGIQVLEEIAGAQLVRVSALLNEAEDVRAIRLPHAKLERLLGFGISHKKVIEALDSVGISAAYSDKTGKNHKAISASSQPNLADDSTIEVMTVPWWRPDVRVAEDLVEEIVRVLGYDMVPSTIPSWKPQRLSFDRQRPVRRRLQGVLLGAGLFEVMTYSFVSKTQLERVGLDPASHLALKNPLSLEQAYLRSSLLASQLTVLAKNRKYGRELGIYEISNVFIKRAVPADQPDEPTMIGITLALPVAGYAALKGIVDGLARELNLEMTVRVAERTGFAAGRVGRVMVGEREVGWIGQVAPRIAQDMKIRGEVVHAELELAALLDASRPKVFKPLSEFPSTYRDLTLLMPVDVAWADVAAELTGVDVNFVEDYYGEGVPAGMKSLTIRVTLALPDRTPTEADAIKLEQSVASRLKRAFKAELR